MARVLLVEDDKSFRRFVRLSLDDRHEVIECESPEAVLCVDSLDTVTHALVDLSFGAFNHLAEERRLNGVDGFAFLDRLAPGCHRVGMSILAEAPHMEIARSIHQFWPGTPILSKLDVDHLLHSITRLLDGGSIESHRDASRATLTTRTMPGWRHEIPSRLAGSGVGNPYTLVDGVASFPIEPTNVMIAERLGVKPSGIPVRLADFRDRLKCYLTDPTSQVGAGLWHWIKPRWAVFDEVRPR